MSNDAARAVSSAAFAYAFDAPHPDSSPAGKPIVVHSEYPIEPHLEVFLLNWPCRAEPPTRAPDIVLRRVGQRAGAALAGRREEELDAMSEFDGVNRMADLLSHVAAQRLDGWAELHASAVLLDGRLALFIGASLSGKSTLALQLAARGARLFADDRLLVGPLDRPSPAGMALGLTPRVRHPPHPAAGVEFARFVQRHLVKAGGNVGFLPLRESLAQCGETAPLGALILPEQRPRGGVELVPASPAAANRVMLEQMHAPRLPAAQFLAAVRNLTAGLPCWHLRYDDSAQAALAVQAMMAG